jgi:hypothetical protein
LLAGNVFYREEFLDIFPKLIIRFNPRKESQGLLKDLVLTVHYVLKLLSSSTTKLFVKKKRQSRKASRAKRKEKADQQQTEGTEDKAQEDKPKDELTQVGILALLLVNKMSQTGCPSCLMMMKMA